MKKSILSKQQRQLRSTIKKLQKALLRRGRRSRQEITSLVLKIKRLSKQLIPQVGYPKLVKMLGITVIYLGSSFVQQLSAQVTFAPAVQNPFGIVVPAEGSADTYSLPAFGDLDGDGDFDMISGDYAQIRYYENIGTKEEPSFQAAVISPFGISVSEDYAIIPTLVDIDDDGDLDIFTATGDVGVSFLENVGTSTDPQFAAAVVEPFGITEDFYYTFPTFADLDGDGDMDLVGGQYEVGFTFAENIGTATEPAFGVIQINPFGLTIPTDDDYLLIPVCVDLDNDGDLDIFAGVYDGDMIYYENVGTAVAPDFAEGEILPFGLSSANEFSFPAFVDIDDDSDQDLFIGEYYGTIQYFENTTFISSLDPLPSNYPLEVYPNPVQDILNIKTNSDITRVELFNVLGQQVLFVEGQEKHISLPDLAKGLYEVKITLADGNFAIKKLIKD